MSMTVITWTKGLCLHFATQSNIVLGITEIWGACSSAYSACLPALKDSCLPHITEYLHRIPRSSTVFSHYSKFKDLISRVLNLIT